MGKLLFVVQCEEDPASITQEADIQMALIGAMKALDMPFTLIPPDVANPGLAVETQPPADGATSFRDIPAFTSGGSYAVDYPLRDLVSWVQKEVEKSGLILCPDFQRGHVWTEKQQEDLSSYAPLIGKEMGRLDLTQSAAALERRIRAMTPWPSAYTSYQGKKLKIWRAEPVFSVNTFGRRPGEILCTDKNSVTVAAGEGALRIYELQLEGRKRMTAHDFLLGVRMQPGEMLG